MNSLSLYAVETNFERHYVTLNYLIIISIITNIISHFREYNTVNLQSFFHTHPVFTRQQLESYLQGNPNTFKNLLAHHLKHGHILRVKRGLFASVPYGVRLESFIVDPYLVIAQLAQDAVVSYHSALAFHGASYSFSYRYIYASFHKNKPFEFQGIDYQPVTPPKALKSLDDALLLSQPESVGLGKVYVTSLQRTLVDVLDRPNLGGGWEEVIRSLDFIDKVNVDEAIEYAFFLRSSSVVAKLGLYLEQRRDELSVSSAQLARLQRGVPASPRYLGQMKKEGGCLVKRWNLIVPEFWLQRGWEEDLGWGSEI